jgi:hypothetical protein
MSDKDERLLKRFLHPIVSEAVADAVRRACDRAETTGEVQTVDLPVEDGFATTPDGRMVASEAKYVRFPIAPEIRLVDRNRRPS